MDLVVPLASAVLGAIGGIVAAVVVRRSESTTKTVTFDANRCFEHINGLERRINEIADQNRDLRSRLAALEVWVRAQGHDPDLIALGQHLRDGHTDLDKES